MEDGQILRFAESHPARGAWIEIASEINISGPPLSRTPHGVRGLKSLARLCRMVEAIVAPRTGCVD